MSRCFTGLQLRLSDMSPRHCTFIHTFLSPRHWNGPVTGRTMMWVWLQIKNECDTSSLSSTGAAQHSKDDCLNVCVAAGNDYCIWFQFLFQLIHSLFIHSEEISIKYHKTWRKGLILIHPQNLKLLPKSIQKANYKTALYERTPKKSVFFYLWQPGEQDGCCPLFA